MKNNSDKDNKNINNSNNHNNSNGLFNSSLLNYVIYNWKSIKIE